LEIDDFRLAAIEDIIIMKMGIVDSPKGGRKKDFWDIHCMLGIFSLEAMLGLFFQQSYSTTTIQEILSRMVDFRRADGNFDPKCRHGKHWELIKMDLEEEAGKLKW
jgi:hypothetical protein